VQEVVPVAVVEAGQSRAARSGQALRTAYRERVARGGSERRGIPGPTASWPRRQRIAHVVDASKRAFPQQGRRPALRPSRPACMKYS
jgi:hypothetical protein